MNTLPSQCQCLLEIVLTYFVRKKSIKAVKGEKVTLNL